MKDDIKKEIQLLALDVDGTLFTKDGKITSASIEAIKQAQEKGVHVVLASGRDYNGLPWKQLEDVPIEYVITTNGSAVYRTSNRECLYEECLDQEKMISLFQYLLEKEVYLSMFLDGENYTPMQCATYVENLGLPEYVKKQLREKFIRVDDIISHMKEQPLRIQKAMVDFQMLPDGRYLNQDEVKTYLKNSPDIYVVDGGFQNLEFTKAGVSKASGLAVLAEYLQIPLEQVMAIGDSENDVAMLAEAGLGVAMGNAAEHVKAVADDVTKTNEEDGVASAIRKYIVS